METTAATSVPPLDLPSRVAVLESEVDRILTTPKEPVKPWYRSLSSLLSVIALVFSLGTTGVSYYRTYTGDIQASRQELRTILQRLSAIPRENFDETQKYKDDPTSAAQIGGLFNQENALLARQAVEIARHLPPRYVSATEYLAIAMALSNAMDMKDCKDFLLLARDSANDLNDEIAARRALAALEFTEGNPDKGRAEFLATRNLFQKYPGFEDITQAQTNATTYLQWANMELGHGFLQQALARLNDAEAEVQKLPLSTTKQSLASQINQMRTFIAQGANPPAPASGPVAMATPIIPPPATSPATVLTPKLRPAP